jgi:hypothetical protein
MKKKANDHKPHLRSIEQIQKAFLEGFISIVLIKCIQPKIIDSDRTDCERRTYLQYLIEVVAAIDCPSFAMVTFAYVNDSMSTNFDDYLSSIKN